MLNVTAQSTVFDHGTTLDGPVSGLTDSHHVSDELTQVLLLCYKLDAGDRLVLHRVLGVGEGRVEI